MADIHLRPDWRRIVERKAVSATVDTAEKIADAARRQGVTVGDVDGGKDEYALPVKVKKHEDSTSVLLAHPSGIAVQAKHGALTRAAAAEGYEVSG